MNYSIPNLKNACKVINYLAEDGRALTYLEVARSLNLPRTTTLRIMETLAEEEFLSKNNRHYKLGQKLADIGECSLSRLKLMDIVEPALARLTNITGETSHFGVQSDNKVWIARVCESPLPLHAASRAGAIVDAHCSGTGKIILADILMKSPDVIKKMKFPKRTKNTITTFSALQKNLKQIIKQGYAIDDEEYHEGVRCLAVPIYDKFKALVGALGITAPANRFTRKDESKIYAIVREVGNEISKKLGLNID